MSKYFFDFRPDFNLFNSDTKRATTIYYTVVYFICSMVYDGHCCNKKQKKHV